MSFYLHGINTLWLSKITAFYRDLVIKSQRTNLELYKRRIPFQSMMTKVGSIFITGINNHWDFPPPPLASLVFCISLVNSWKYAIYVSFITANKQYETAAICLGGNEGHFHDRICAPEYFWKLGSSADVVVGITSAPRESSPLNLW